MHPQQLTQLDIELRQGESVRITHGPGYLRVDVDVSGEGHDHMAAAIGQYVTASAMWSRAEIGARVDLYGDVSLVVSKKIRELLTDVRNRIEI